MPKYPDVEVSLVGENGNTFVIVGKVRKALRRHGVPSSEIEEFSQEALSGDYDKVLQTCMGWVSVI